jgi:Zn-finger nucleic acid-binding protein
MRCPHCNETLLMTERNSIEIDYCPSCRGVWLDKGELDKMLLYAAQSAPDNHTVPHSFGTQGAYYAHSQQQYGYNKQHKKKSFLNDLFDFD